MSISDRLDEIEARCDAATDGPWVWASHSTVDGDEWAVFDTDDHALAMNRDGWTADAAFIAHARTDVPALVAALRAVLDLHKRVANTGVCHTEGCPCTLPEWTCTCQLERHDEYSPWPCPTVLTVQAALGEVQP